MKIRDTNVALAAVSAPGGLFRAIGRTRLNWSHIGGRSMRKPLAFLLTVLVWGACAPRGQALIVGSIEDVPPSRFQPGERM